MKIIFVLTIKLLFVMLLTSCKIFQERSPSSQNSLPDNQSANQSALLPQKGTLLEYHNANTDLVFQAIMNNETIGEKSAEFEKYVDRQRKVYYIAQKLLLEFDKELDRIYKQKQTPLQSNEKINFYKLRYKMNIAWEFSERNLHELVDIYQKVLDCANDITNENKKVCGYIVVNTTKRLDKVWKKAVERHSILALTQEMSEVHERILLKYPQAKLPDLSKYTNAGPQAFDSLLIKNSMLDKIYVSKDDLAVEKLWNKYFENNFNSEIFETYYNENSSRLPQALDNVYPDPGPNGHVTGNYFPQGYWAITFDDGPHPQHTSAVFKLFNEHKSTVAFFWLTKNVKAYPEKVLQAKEYGFNRASHSYTHANLPKLSLEGVHHEITRAVDDFAVVAGEKPTLFRCPYGACGGNNSTIRKKIANENMLEIFWNVDSMDWQDKNPKSIFERTKKQMELLNRGIVLFHDIHPQSVQAAALLLDYLETKSDWKTVLLSEAISKSRDKEFTSP
jgi:peptidoglycan/xylan/chitin deacetylase (PgdA/CDA1 family)